MQTALVLVYEFAFALPGFFVQFQDRADLAQSVVASLLAAPLTERKRWAPVYLRTCVRNEARKRWKRRNGAPSALDPEKLDALADDSRRGGGASCPPGCGDGALADCDQGARDRFIQDLPPFQRRVLELRLADVSIHAIAAIVERSRSQVQDALREVSGSSNGSPPRGSPPPMTGQTATDRASEGSGGQRACLGLASSGDPVADGNQSREAGGRIPFPEVAPWRFRGIGCPIRSSGESHPWRFRMSVRSGFRSIAATPLVRAVPSHVGIVAQILRWLLAIGFFLIGSTKLVHGYESSFALGPLMWHVATVCEIAIGAILAQGFVRIGAAAGALFFALASVVSWNIPHHADCGCLVGILRGSRSSHVMTSGIGGALCVTLSLLFRSAGISQGAGGLAESGTV